MIEIGYYNSPIGIFKITGTANGVQSVTLQIEMTVMPPENMPSFLVTCAEQLAEYFAGNRSEFDLKLDFSSGTAFNQSVWNALLEVPYGLTTTYLKIAQSLENPKAVRAVGLANKHNPIAIIVPCHRCIASNGNLQGYFYGLDIKRQLLELENPMSFARQGSLF
jgi:methylated-DNA-[protein]-cysteine S-methyltransferase